MLFAIALTTLAGLATVIGGLIGTHPRMMRNQSLAAALGFSAGAMLYISLVDLLPEGQSLLSERFGESGLWVAGAGFLLGMCAVGALNLVLPHSGNDGADAFIGRHKMDARQRQKLLRSGIMVAVALALHNLPEGMVTLIGALHDPTIGVSLAIAIALHNLPEGIAIAAPIYAATRSRAKALWYSATSALAEPVGAIAGYALLSVIMPGEMTGIMFVFVAGIMVCISIGELLPAARDYETRRRQTMIGFVAGVCIMLVSINLLGG